MGSRGAGGPASARGTGEALLQQQSRPAPQVPLLKMEVLRGRGRPDLLLRAAQQFHSFTFFFFLTVNSAGQTQRKPFLKKKSFVV